MHAEFSVVSFLRPGAVKQIPIGLLLRDIKLDQLRVRFRTDFTAIANEEEAEVLSGLSDQFVQCAQEMGAKGFLEYLQDAASMSVQVTDPTTIQADNIDLVMNSLYLQYVDNTVSSLP